MSNDWLRWEVSFKDGTFLSQFDETGFETSFKVVQEKTDEVATFKLVGDGNSYSVSLSKGSISINSVIINFFEDYDNYSYRLIFFKRRLNAVYTTSIETHYWIGFQTTVGEKNIQRVLQITSKGIYLKDKFEPRG